MGSFITSLLGVPELELGPTLSVPSLCWADLTVVEAPPHLHQIPSVLFHSTVGFMTSAAGSGLSTRKTLENQTASVAQWVQCDIIAAKVSPFIQHMAQRLQALAALGRPFPNGTNYDNTSGHTIPFDTKNNIHSMF